jgi:hypothetical protein
MPCRYGGGREHYGELPCTSSKRMPLAVVRAGQNGRCPFDGSAASVNAPFHTSASCIVSILLCSDGCAGWPPGLCREQRLKNRQGNQSAAVSRQSVLGQSMSRRRSLGQEATKNTVTSNPIGMGRRGRAKSAAFLSTGTRSGTNDEIHCGQHSGGPSLQVSEIIPVPLTATRGGAGRGP